MARGLIEGALGGLAQAAGGIAEGHIKNEQELDLRKELSAIEEQRQMRIMEATESRRRSGRQADFDQDLANAPKRNQAEVDRVKTVGPAETDAAVDRAKKVGAATGATQREQEAAFGNDPAAQAGVRARAKASDMGAGERSLRNEELRLRIDELKVSAAEKREMREMLNQAAEERASGNDDAADQIINTLRTKTGATVKSGEKSMTDAVGAARVLTKAAEDAELSDPDEARRLRAEAADIVRGVASKRGVGGGGKPAPGAPYPEGTQLKGPDGKRYVVRDGKPVLAEGGRKASGTVTQE